VYQVLRCERELRRRDSGYPEPPPQSRTCGFPASGSSVARAFARTVTVTRFTCQLLSPTLTAARAKLRRRAKRPPQFGVGLAGLLGDFIHSSHEKLSLAPFLPPFLPRDLTDSHQRDRTEWKNRMSRRSIFPEAGSSTQSRKTRRTVLLLC
jgi:hypothetical protein